jgi:hypothetical protein
VSSVALPALTWYSFAGQVLWTWHCVGLADASHAAVLNSLLPQVPHAKQLVSRWREEPWYVGPLHSTQLASASLVYASIFCPAPQNGCSVHEMSWLLPIL